jgi:hypothetical protein
VTDVSSSHGHRCAYCGKEMYGEPNASIHRDALGVGPEVPLCDGCGLWPLPTCEQIWDRISTLSKEERERAEEDFGDVLDAIVEGKKS